MSETYNYELPIIATRGVVVFPGTIETIEIGRSISINALQLASQQYDGRVFIVSQIDANTSRPTYDDLYKVGTICQIQKQFNKGSFVRATFKGIGRATLNNVIYGDDLMVADCNSRDIVKDDPTKETVLVNKIISELTNNRTMAIYGDSLAKISTSMTSEQIAYQFARNYSTNFERKQKLLETDNLNELLENIIEIITTEKQMAKVENEINEKVKSRIDQGQREYYLREKLRTIKEELGDVSNSSDDASELRELIENGNYPDHIKERALDELAHFEMLPMGSQEASVIRSYLDWLLGVPWTVETKDNEDINDIEQKLNNDHYGLEKVKQRILEYIAVKQMTNSLNAPILCLVGPPGVGKTSLAKSVANALDRHFVKMSVGGVKDEAEIRGHRRTYLGSMPGRIIQCMKKAQCINPVFLIDEIDKLGYDYKGDPSSAMLEVLDPEQNSLFSDNYLEEPYDLSKVLFITTANYLENIPDPLRDRLEIIDLSSYTEVDKLHIAKDHLIAKQCHANGLKESQFKIKDDVLLYLIRYYTREAGVRQLERSIGALCRKTVLEILKGNKKSVTITKKLVNQWLGKEKFDYGKKEKANQIGVVTGLAYTSFGGDILQIEVTTFKGHGKLIVTGQLGDVMKESTSIALGFVKSHAQEYGIDAKFFEENDIHIHVPEGAVPKDGPSAGVTITTAIVSALTQRFVKNDIAMTGEVTLRGNVLPIGGLKEKSLAAHRSGIKEIIIPKDNVKDIDDIPQEVRDDINFISCAHVSEVIKTALVAHE